MTNLPMENMGKSLAKALQVNQEAAPTAKQFLKLDQDEGVWVFGANADEVEPDSGWILNLETFQHGYFQVAESGIPQDKQLVPVLGGEIEKPKPAKDCTLKLGYFGEFKCIKGTQKGVVVTYEHCSTGACQFYQRLIQSIARQHEKDAEHIFPVIAFGVGEYQWKKVRTIYTPTCAVLGWASSYEVKDFKGDTVEQEQLPWKEDE